jgi:amidase
LIYEVWHNFALLSGDISRVKEGMLYKLKCSNHKLIISNAKEAKMADELFEYDAVALGELTRKGDISPTEILDITIQRIEEFNPKLNAVIHRMSDQAAEAAKSWSVEIKAGKASDVVFCGVPFLLKDLLAEYKGPHLLRDRERFRAISRN